MRHITEEEYYGWIKSSKRIGDGPMFTSCCGPHEFSDLICRDGMLYYLYNGFYPEEDKDPNAKYKCKTVYWWGVKLLRKADGQDGEGI